MGTVLELKNVTKKLGGRRVVDDLSFTVEAGEIFGFLGPNGAGKTTTIKMIVGLLDIDRGEILVNGKNVRRSFERAMRDIGAIIENPEMYEYLSGKKNLKLYGRMYKRIPKARYAEVIEAVGLSGRIKDKVKKYSLGMRQRLGLAQALLHNPKLLILDEPTNGLDPEGIKELRDTLRDLADNHGVAVLVSSHLLSEMELMCDRFGIIDHGVLSDIRSLADIKSGENVAGAAHYNFEVGSEELALNVINEYLTPVIDRLSEEPLSVADEIDPSELQDIVTTEPTLPISSGNRITDLSSVELTREQVAGINRALVAAGVDVYSITRSTHSLEDEFLSIVHSAEAENSSKGKKKKKKEKKKKEKDSAKEETKE